MQARKEIFVVEQTGILAIQLAAPEALPLEDARMIVEQPVVERHVNGCYRMGSRALGAERANMVELHIPGPHLTMFGNLQIFQTYQRHFQEDQKILSITVIKQTSMGQKIRAQGTE